MVSRAVQFRFTLILTHSKVDVTGIGEEVFNSMPIIQCAGIIETVNMPIRVHLVVMSMTFHNNMGGVSLFLP